MSHAQDVLDAIIKLKPGKWNNTQSIEINGVEIPASTLSKSHCVTASEAHLTVKEYSEKMMQGLGTDSQCDISNLRKNVGQVSFNLTCFPEEGLRSSMGVTYNYNHTQVTILANGTMEGGGRSVPIKVTALTKFTGDCNVEGNVKSDAGIHNDTVVLKDDDTHNFDSKKDQVVERKHDIVNIKASDLGKFFKRLRHNKPIIVNFTSTDGSCKNCLKNNKSFKRAHDKLYRDFTFLQVTKEIWSIKSQVLILRL